ncbi:MAG TPA: hypothetical protein VGC92_01405 [Phenylobacterium sp.]
MEHVSREIIEIPIPHKPGWCGRVDVWGARIGEQLDTDAPCVLICTEMPEAEAVAALGPLQSATTWLTNAWDRGLADGLVNSMDLQPGLVRFISHTPTEPTHFAEVTFTVRTPRVQGGGVTRPASFRGARFDHRSRVEVLRIIGRDCYGDYHGPPVAVPRGLLNALLEHYEFEDLVPPLDALRALRDDSLEFPEGDIL